MSMRLNPEQREVLWESLYLYLEHYSGENEVKEQIARKLQKRLDNFVAHSGSNRAGGMVNQSHLRHKVATLEGMLQGATGKSSREWLALAEAQPAESNPEPAPKEESER